MLAQLLRLLTCCSPNPAGFFSQDMHTLLRDGKWDPPEMGSTEARLYGVVYFSFSRLSEAAQNIFLDSVSVLQGQPLSKAMLVWEEWWPGQAQPALQKLKQLSLISTKPGRESRWGHALRGNEPHGILDERITTLDVIRWLGQSIILKNDMPGGLGDKYYCSRIWVTSQGEVSPGQELLKVSPVHIMIASTPILQCMVQAC
jgi:hypothetical protein